MKKKKIITIVIISLVALIVVGAIARLVYYLAVELPNKKELERQIEWYNQFYQQQVDKYSAENELYDDFEVDVAFLGDSLTAGYDVKSYYSEYLVTNRGIGGDTTHGLYDRLKVSVLDLKPKVCVMLIGTNNMDTMFDDYEDILILFKQQMPNTKVILLSLAPTNDPYSDRNEKYAHNNVKIKLLAEKYGYEFVDIYTPMFDLETGKLKAEYTSDGIHFTQEGYVVFTNALKPVVDRLLQQIANTN